MQAWMHIFDLWFFHEPRISKHFCLVPVRGVFKIIKFDKINKHISSLSESSFISSIIKEFYIFFEISRCSSISKRSIEEVWDRPPNHFQSKIMSLMMQMMIRDFTSEDLLLVQPTWSDKSSVTQNVSVAKSGTTIIIKLTWTLSSD